MLQISILHIGETIRICEIKNLETCETIATFDEEKGTIDIEPLVSHIGEMITVTHFVRDNGCTRLDYSHEKTLTKVDKDENGVWFLEYN